MDIYYLRFLIVTKWLYLRKKVFSRKFIIRALAVIGLYVAVTSYIFKNEEWFFFDHDDVSKQERYSFTVPFQELNIKINEAIQLHALLFRQKEAKALILKFPGSNYQSVDYEADMDLYYQLGYSVLIPEYRDSGKSTSVFKSEDDIYADAQQWYKMAKRLADSVPLIVVGKDFGCGAAAWVGAENTVDLVVLDTPYYSWNKVMLRKYFWWLPHTYLTQYKIPVWEFVRKSMNKTILIHATEADNIKYNHSLQLLEYLKTGDELITLDNDDEDANKHQYKREIQRILDNILQAN